MMEVFCVFIQTLECQPFKHNLVISNGIQDDKKKRKYAKLKYNIKRFS